MAEETQKRIFEVNIEATEALKRLAELKLRSGELREAQKSLGKVTAENAEEYYRLATEIKMNDQAAKEAQKQVERNVKATNNAEGSLNRLRAELARDTQEYNKLGDSAQDAGKKADLALVIKATSDEIKRQEEALGNFKSSVGNYAIAGQSLRKELKELTMQLQQMALAGDTSSEAFRKLNERAKELRGVQTNINAMTSGETAGIQATRTLSNSVTMLLGAYTAYNAVAGKTNKNNEQMQKLFQKITIAMVALNALQQIQSNLLKTSNAYRIITNLLQRVGIDQTNAETRAIAARNAMVNAGTVSEKLAATATWLWNAALSANPVVLVTMAIVALVAGIYGLTKAFQSSSKYSNEAKVAMENYKQVADETEKALNKIEAETKVATANMETETLKQVEALKKVGASEDEIAKVTTDGENKRLKAEQKSNKQRLGLMKDERTALLEAIRAKQQELNTWEGSSKRYKKEAEALNELCESYNKLQTEIADTALEIQKADNAILDNVLENGKRLQEQRDTERAEALDAALKNLEQMQKIEEDDYKYQHTWRANNTAETIKYNIGLQAIQNEYERKKLADQYKYGDLSLEAYKAQMEAINRAERQMYADSEKQLIEYNASVLKSVESFTGATNKIEEKILEVENEYNNIVSQLETIQYPEMVPGMSEADFNEAVAVWERLMLERAAVEEELTNAKNAKIKALEEKNTQEILKQRDSDIAKSYDEDLVRAQENENEKLRVEINAIRERIEARRELGEATYQLEAELAQKEAKLRANGYAQEIADARGNTRRVYEIRLKQMQDESARRMQVLAAELEANADNAEEAARLWGEMEAERTRQTQAESDLRKDMILEETEQVLDYLDQIGQLGDKLNELFAQLAENQTAKIEEEYDKRKEALDNQLNRGIISQKAYNAEMERLEAEQAQKTAEIEREQAEREKAMSIFQIIIETAMAITKALSSTPPPASYVYAALSAAMGAAELAAVIAEPLPKASKGKYISGPSHAGGGVNIEAEGGEVIINKRSTAMYLPLLSAINEAGGGVPFAKFADGGYVARSAGVSNANIQAGASEAITEAMEEQKIYVTVEDIRRADKRYTQVESRGKW